MKISVLGLGIIGSAWAKNLIADGHAVRCWNRTPKDFPNFDASIQEAVDQAEVRALAPNVAHSGVSDLKGPKLRQHDYSPQFSLKNMAKDLRLALETAAEFSLPLEQTGHLKSLYDQGMTTGWSNDDFIGLMRLMETQA